MCNNAESMRNISLNMLFHKNFITIILLVVIFIITGCIQDNKSKTLTESVVTPPSVSASPTNLTYGWIAPPNGTIVIDIWLLSGKPYLPFIDQSYDTPNNLVIPAIYAELVRMDANGNYIPYLAEGLPTFKNGLTRYVGEGEDRFLEVEFRLRPGVTWQDGYPLTANDLVFSWELVMQPDWPGKHWGSIEWAPEVFVNSVEALSPEQVVFRFMSQRQARIAAKNGGRLADNSYYTSLFTQVGPIVPLDYMDVGRNVFPKHILANIPASQISESDFANNPIYAGAYHLIEGGGEEHSIVLEANDNFVLGSPELRRIVFGSNYYSPAATTYWQNPDILAIAMKFGAIQAQLGFRGINSRQGESYTSYDDLNSLANVKWVSVDGWETLDFNLDNIHLADLRVRQAITYAIDRQKLIDQVLDDHGRIMRSYLPDWHPLYAGVGALPDYPYNPGQARTLLEQAGYDLGVFPAVHPVRGRLILSLKSMDIAPYARQEIANLIKDELSTVGILVNIQFYSFSEFEGDDCSSIRNGRMFDLGLAGWLELGRFPITYVEMATASWNIPTTENSCPIDRANWSGWSNARADEIIPMLEDGRLALEHPDEYRNLWIEHQQLWANDLPSLPLFNWQRPVVTAMGLHGVQPSPFFSQGVEDTWNIFEWVWK